ncbi:SDR family oxidoreductase [Ginsengibacter hankyongi]|uniref:SDR family oxidoreductase n=1 Tax=Ginsengibacter hankyongi TaxID=2607284 RepID=A0A5J5IDM9_9BACT|nr:SDR family oxidoreductase [Ginsengibacter hankyongi]KAA9037266.1 SDR family oxidoreductase [Ginsengibacter hankyongi]
MSAQTIFITGATDGIGKLTARDLAKLNKDAAILIHGRNKIKLDKVIEEIKSASGNQNVEGYIADLSSMDDVRKLANDVLAKHDKINILINNAGAGFAASRYGKDGTETRFTVNYLAPFLLTHLLLPAIKNAAPSRIINVASAGQSPVNFKDIMLEKSFDGLTAYTQSKLALIMFTIDLADELKNDNVTVNSLHPGTYLDTNMVHDAGIKPHGTAQSGADATIYLATSPTLKNTTGEYFNVKNEAKANAQAYDMDARKQLRNLSLKLTNLT